VVKNVVNLEPLVKTQYAVSSLFVDIKTYITQTIVVELGYLQTHIVLTSQHPILDSNVVLAFGICNGITQVNYE
jgi:hypothetical protein